MFAFFCSMGAYEEPKETCGTICLKYLLFAFNFLFWVSLHPLLWGFECISHGSWAATCFLQGSKLFQSGRCWSAGKHWWMRKTRWDCFIFKQVKNRNNWLIPAAFLAGGITAKLLLLPLKTRWCVQRPGPLNFPVMRTWCSGREQTTNSCHIWMRSIKLSQARHWFRVWNRTRGSAHMW